MADTTPSQPEGTSQPARQYRPSRGRRVGDAIISMFIRAGLVPSSYLLTTRGRKTGRPRTNPVTVLERYVGIATATRPYFQAAKDASVEDFIAEADRHPVFELTPLTRDRPDDHRESCQGKRQLL